MSCCPAYFISENSADPYLFFTFSGIYSPTNYSIIFRLVFSIHEHDQGR
jgi:hypothetical protein